MTENRRTGLWMIALAVTSLAAWVLTDVPDIEETDDQALAFYAAGPGPAQTIVAFYLTLLFVGCLFAWLGSLQRWLSSQNSHLPTLGRDAAVGYTTLVVAGQSAFLLPTGYDRLGFGPNPEPGGDPLFLRTASAMGDAFALIGAPVLLAVTVAVVCRAMKNARLTPRWAIVSGYLVAALLLIGWTWFPLLLFALWALVLGVVLALPRPTPHPVATLHEPRSHGPTPGRQR